MYIQLYQNVARAEKNDIRYMYIMYIHTSFIHIFSLLFDIFTLLFVSIFLQTSLFVSNGKCSTEFSV